MTLCDRLACRYAITILACLLLLGGLTYHEFVLEPQRTGQPASPSTGPSSWEPAFELVVGGLVLAVLGGGWWLMRRSLAPLHQLARAVENIHAHNLTQPLPRTFNGDEVDRLTEVFNAMAGRLHQSFEQIRVFTLHASHELKTPLTVIRAQLEMALVDDSPQPLQAKDWIPSLLDEIDRLTNIVNGLALLTKADAGQLVLERKPVPLAELLRESYEDTLILGQPLDLQVRLVQQHDPIVLGDRQRLRQLLLNLTDNAVKYNQPGGQVVMNLSQTNGDAELAITNTGEGIPPELQARLFERFVRGDEARRKAIEGCGLGLSIAQWIVHAHHGDIQISSQLGRQTTVRVRLPLMTVPATAYSNYLCECI